MNVRTKPRRAVAAVALVLSAIVGPVTNMVTDQRAGAWLLGAAVLILLVASGAALAWAPARQSGAGGSPVTTMDQAQPRLGSVAPPWVCFLDRYAEEMN